MEESTGTDPLGILKKAPSKESQGSDPLGILKKKSPEPTFHNQFRKVVHQD